MIPWILWPRHSWLFVSVNAVRHRFHFVKWAENPIGKGLIYSYNIHTNVVLAGMFYKVNNCTFHCSQMQKIINYFSPLLVHTELSSTVTTSEKGIKFPDQNQLHISSCLKYVPHSAIGFYNKFRGYSKTITIACNIPCSIKYSTYSVVLLQSY